MPDCCLDTTVLIDLLRGTKEAGTAIRSYREPCISHVVFGELLLGTLKSSKPEAERRKLFDALVGMTVLNADAWTSTLFATTRFQLEKVGGLIPQNDIWIAIQAKTAADNARLSFSPCATSHPCGVLDAEWNRPELALPPSSALDYLSHVARPLLP